MRRNLSYPSLIALAHTIERRDYYAALERNNKRMKVTDWLTSLSVQPPLSIVSHHRGGFQ
jgi:hypothetical protein